MSESHRPLASPSSGGEKEVLSLLLSSGFPAILHLPEPVEQEFRAYYRQVSLRLLRRMVFALIALYFAVVWPVSLFIDSPFLPLWQNYAVVPIGAVLVVLWTASRVDAVARHIETTLATSLFVCLTGTIYCAVQLNRQYLGQVAAYETMYVMMIAFSILRIPMRLATASAVAAFILVLIVAASQESLVLWPDIFMYAMVPLAICSAGGCIAECSERRSFLQLRLLALQERQLEGLNRLARLDALSGLANRRHLDETLKREWERARREGHFVAILFVDIDYFKRYNDNYGHSAGDHCLAMIGRILGEVLHRPADLAARYGGEEFVLLLPNTGDTGAQQVAERLMEKIHRLDLPHLHSPIAQRVTVSIGIASCIPARDEDAQALVDAADEALYRSKTAGRNRVTVGHCGTRRAGQLGSSVPVALTNSFVQA